MSQWPAGVRPAGHRPDRRLRSRGAAAAASRVLDTCHTLFGETVGLGLGGADMVAVLRAIEPRTENGPEALRQS